MNPSTVPRNVPGDDHPRRTGRPPGTAAPSRESSPGTENAMPPLDRRAFLKTSSAVLAGSYLGSGGTAHADSGDRLMIKKAIKIGMAPRDLPLVERFRLIKSCGFDGVDMDSPGPYDARRGPAGPRRQRPGDPRLRLLDALEGPALQPRPGRPRETVEAMRQALEDCKAWGGTTVLLVPAVVSAEIPYDVAYERSQEEIRTLLDDAERTGITIAFENVWNNFLLSPLEFARYVDEFESEKVGAYFDIGNVVRFGWPEQWVRILGRPDRQARRQGVQPRAAGERRAPQGLRRQARRGLDRLGRRPPGHRRDRLHAATPPPRSAAATRRT